MISINLDMTKVSVVNAIVKFHDLLVSISKTQQTCDTESLINNN